MTTFDRLVECMVVHDAPHSSDAPGALDEARLEIARLRQELAQTKLREAELVQQNQQNAVYRAIVESLPSGAVFAFDRDFRFIAAEGPELRQGVGFSKEEIEGRTLREVIAPEHFMQLEPLYCDTLAGRSRRVEVRRGGRVFDVRTVPMYDADGAIVAGLVKSYDVTERHQETERLRTVTAQLALLLDHLSTGVVFSDKSGNIQIVNRAMGMLLGMSNPTELIGTRMTDAMHSARFEDGDAVTRTVGERARVRMPVIGDRLHLKSGRILERDYLPVEMRGAFGGDLWCYRDVTDRERARAQLADQANVLRELSMKDELTRLNNRRGFMHLGEQQVKLADRGGRPVALFFIDLNGMKAINDRLGHDEGDRALLDAAQLLVQTFRDSDVVARLGGDEFVVLATDCPGSMVPIVKNRLQAALDLFNGEPARRYQLSMSIGVATYDRAGRQSRTIEDLLAEADERMYEEKVRTYRSAAPRSSVVCERPMPSSAGPVSAVCERPSVAPAALEKRWLSSAPPAAAAR
ncbi:MAG TPA: diguanylate cyclase [Polyangiaceae bacterium]|jgi:diguanylate cyclase (GGDEF)-like protein/PAS domain S-box-containing protein|nr:diguanylate cyclase [Polyangiaceae bacterium]